MKIIKFLTIVISAVIAFAACIPSIKLKDAYSIEGEYFGTLSLVTHSDEPKGANVKITAVNAEKVKIDIYSSMMDDLNIERTDESALLEVSEGYAKVISDGTMISGMVKNDVLTLSFSHNMGNHVCDMNNDGQIDEDTEYIRDIVSFIFVGTKNK